MKNRVITLALLPVFALTACGQDDAEPERSVAPKEASAVVQNTDGSYTTDPLILSYRDAKAEGYTGSLEDWAKLTKLYEKDPEEAQRVVQQSGFDGGDMLLAGIAGAYIGSLSSNSNGYHYQRPTHTTHVVHKTKYVTVREKEKKNTSATAAYVPRPTSTTRSSAPTSYTSKTTTTTTSYKPSSSVSSSSSSSRSSFTSVSRGGFGGARSSGG